MRRSLIALLLFAGSFHAALPSYGQIRAVPRLAAPVTPVIPVARGPVMQALNTQLSLLTPAQSAPELRAAFQRHIAPAPMGAAATPGAFAARAAITQALAQPRTALPALAASIRAAGGRKAERAAESLEQVAEVLAEASAKERGSVTRSAGALLARFDGASAAPDEAVDLSAIPTQEDRPGRKKTARRQAEEDEKLRALQEKLFAQAKHADAPRSLAVWVQAIDTAGKDGVVKHGLKVNPAWASVTSFGKPTEAEAAEHYSARIERAMPAKGQIGVHVRTIYEDIIVPALFGLLPQAELAKRFGEVLRFEREQALKGRTLHKVFLTLSKKAQRERLQDRVDDPEKRWKYDERDLETRARWQDIQRIYATLLARTSTVYAPWNVIGADDKPARNLAFTRGVRKRLQRMKPRYPERPELEGVRIPK
jgi:polyphosphate kinase 2 (PPK2 family)